MENRNLQQSFNEKETMSSLEIAELTGKKHKHVMEAIRKMVPSWKKVCGTDFRLTFRSVEQPNGGTRYEPYYLLTKTECLFIATKFNDEARAKLVLRWERLEKQHISTTTAIQPKSSAEMLLLYAQQMVEQEKRITDIEARQAAIENRINGVVEYSTIVGYANRYNINVNLEKATHLGKVAKILCYQYQFETGKVPDPRFGTVRTYPDSVLKEVFEKYYPNIRF